MKKICVVTATRAEYGILKPLIRRLGQCAEWETQLVATGSHLVESLGNTYQEIEQDGIGIFEKIPIYVEGDTPYAVSSMMARALLGFGSYFQREKPDMVVVLGDRTELLGICGAALSERIPIAHIHGGELTEGAVDDSIRHAVTKMSYLHFASAEEYRRRIIQMGEDPKRVWNVGALGVENILKEPLLSREEWEEQMGFSSGQDYGVVTFHPVTLEGESIAQVRELVSAMEERKDLFFLITKSNADAGGNAVNAYLKQAVESRSNMKLVASLGMKRYLSAVKYARFVLGNSSSGILEAPSLHVPTVNIGSRQKGRIMADSIISCEPDRAAIGKAIDKAMKMDCSSYKCPYGTGDTSRRIVAVLKRELSRDSIDLKKQFYDISWKEEPQNIE